MHGSYRWVHLRFGGASMRPRRAGNIWIRMSNRRITNAIAREERAAARAEQSVLRKERGLKKVKVGAEKTKLRIKIGLGGDGIAFEQGRISMEEFQRRAARAGHELREVNEALAKIGLRIGEGQRDARGEKPPTVTPPRRTAHPSPRRRLCGSGWHPPRSSGAGCVRSLG